MALSKIQAESMNLADTYAFSGTVSGTSVAGSGAFMARIEGNNEWRSLAGDNVIPFNNVSTGDSFDTDGVFNTSTYKFVAPATGVYTFWYVIYTADADTANAFTFFKNTAKINANGLGCNFSYWNGSNNDHIQSSSVIINLSSGDTMGVSPTQTSDYYTGLSQWGGCRLA